MTVQATRWEISVTMVETDRDGKPRPWTLNDRPHWTRARTNASRIRQDVQWLVKQQRVPRLERITVQLHYAPGDNRRRDEDNLAITSKHAVDGLVRAGVVQDDSPEFVTHLMPVIHKGARERRLWLEITAAGPVTPDDPCSPVYDPPGDRDDTTQHDETRTR